MIQIIADIRPFQLNQKISVYQDGAEIDSAKTNIENFVSVVRGFKNKYNADKVKLIGGNQFLKKFQKDLSTDFDIANIEIISR